MSGTGGGMKGGGVLSGSTGADGADGTEGAGGGLAGGGEGKGRSCGSGGIGNTARSYEGGGGREVFKQLPLGSEMCSDVVLVTLKSISEVDCN